MYGYKGWWGCLLLFSLTAMADERPLPGFYAEVSFDSGYEGNVRRTQGSDQEGSWFLRAQPELGQVFVFGKHDLQLALAGNHKYFTTLQDENVNDLKLEGDLNLDLSPKLDVNLDGYIMRAHDERGGTDGTTVNASKNPNRWNEWQLKGGVTYGRRTNQAQVQLWLSHEERRYKNNNQQYRDRDTDILGATLFYNGIGPKTQLLLQGTFDLIDYLRPEYKGPNALELDSSEIRLSAGLAWDATAKTTGNLLIGWFEKAYDQSDENLDTRNGLYAEANLLWSPKTYSHVALHLLRDVYDSTSGDNGYNVVASEITLNWRHQLTSRFHFDLGGRYEHDDFANISRIDEVYGARAGVYYTFRRWLDIGVGYEYLTRQSDFPDEEWDSSSLMLTIRSNLGTRFGWRPGTTIE